MKQKISSQDYTIIKAENIEAIKLKPLNHKREVTKKIKYERDEHGQKHKKEYYYIERYLSFDIETTSYLTLKGEKMGFMYVWQMCIDDFIIYGRTWQEFRDTLKCINKKLGLRNDDAKCPRLVIYIHNASYEFHFLMKELKIDEVFCLDVHKVGYFRSGNFEFRCSYLLSGLGLEKTAENMTKYDVKKLKGYNYGLIRHSKTPLSKFELEYCFMDVIVVQNYIKEQIGLYGSITKIPMTNTGRVRRYIQEACLGNDKTSGAYRSKIKQLRLDTEIYDLVKRAFMGGRCGSNDTLTDTVLYNVGSFDESSAYPSMACTEKRFPMYTPLKVDFSVLEPEKRDMYINTKCCVFDVKFINLRRKKSVFYSYISSSKCEIRNNHEKSVIIDNGRIKQAYDKNNPVEIVTTITEVDLEIINKMYDYDGIEYGKGVIFTRGYLPKEIVESFLYFYKIKTTLKGVIGKEVEYLLYKGMLNSGYGMMVYDPIKENFYFKDGSFSSSDKDLAKQLKNGEITLNEYDEKIEEIKNGKIKAYNNDIMRSLYYVWGVYITALNRLALMDLIVIVGKDFVYCDTDSVKALNYKKYNKDIEKINKVRMLKAYNCLRALKIDINEYSPIQYTVKGVEKKIGVFEFEGVYKRFKTLGAKRYLVEYENGDIEITVAGLPKVMGKVYLMQEAKKRNVDVFELFSDGLTIEKNYEYDNIILEEIGAEEVKSKKSHYYQTETVKTIVYDYRGVPCEIVSHSGVYLEDVPFSLSLSEDYSQLINENVTTLAL